MRVRELPPLEHTIEVQTPGGRRYRWATDEPDPANVLGNLRWSSTMPGGWEEGDCVLPRKPSVDYDDLERFSEVRIRDAGLESVGEYRLERAPRTSGDEMSVSPGMTGWQAHLDDNTAASFLGVDADISQFGPPSRAWKVAQLAAGYQQADGSVAPDATSGLPALVLGFDDPGVAKAAATARYDAGAGNKIGRVYYDVDAAPATIAHDAFSWAWRLYTSDVDDLSAVSTTTFTGPTGYLDVPSKRYLIPEFRWDFTSSPGAGTWELHFRNLRVYGDHGLTLRGPAPGGLYASDIVAHVVGLFAPLLGFTTGAGGTIAPSAFVIDHFAFKDATTGGELVRQATRFELQDWAVWNDRTFYWNARGTGGRTWRARVGPAQLSETGPQTDRLWESVVVAYRDVDGSTKTVGPPGSGADSESTDLKDYDPDNPANKVGAIRRDLLQMGTAPGPAAATQVGRRFLEQAKLLDSSGKATFVGHVEDDRGVIHPYSHVRAGDQVVFVDAHDTQPRRIVKATNSHDERSCSVDLDAPPEGLQALLEQLGVVLVPLGLS